MFTFLWGKALVTVNKICNRRHLLEESVFVKVIIYTPADWMNTKINIYTHTQLYMYPTDEKFIEDGSPITFQKTLELHYYVPNI